MNYIEEIQSNRKFWEKVLGNEICINVLSEDEWQTDFEEPKLKIVGELYQKVLADKTELEYTIDDGTFSDFNQIFIKTACLYKKTHKMNLLENVKANITYNLPKRIKQIYLRILVQDIHRLKEDNRLRGNNSEEEYEDYRQRFLKDRSYVHKLCEGYPEMKRLLFLQIERLVQLFWDIEAAVSKDKEHLVKDFCSGQDFGRIQKVECGFSDSHNGGKAVAKVKLDNGYTLIYKPHSLGKELLFQEVYGHFLEYAGLENNKIQMLDCGSYGWQAYVRQQECHSIQEVERYFQRLGILLFLCYLMNANDIHQENIIASGEYPFLLDLETFPGCRRQIHIQNAEQKVRESINSSVLCTGLLPVLMWGGSGEGIIVSALHRGQKELTPFRLPVACQLGSSEIHIEYQQKELTAGSSLPVYKGRDVNSADYEANLVKGFTAAYRFMLEDKEQLEKMLESFFEYKSRVLLRHTQQYSMFLQTSLYPEFLESGTKRRLFLHVLEKQRMPEKINLYEKSSLRQMDIPIFYVIGKDRSLYTGDDVQIPEFYQKSAYELWKEKMDRLGEGDLEMQLRFIKLSMALLEKEPVQGRKCITKKGASVPKAEQVVRKIADEICRTAFMYEPIEDISWSGLRFFEEKSWSIVPLGIYLYDGLGGAAVFLATVVKKYQSLQYQRSWRLVAKKLFDYTEQVLKGERKTESNHSGAFVGEGSLVYTYLLLYRITEDVTFLEYAKKHVLIVEQVAEKDESPDLLSGLAGAIVVICKLYQEEKDQRYLEMAVRWGEKLWERAQKQEIGYGIPIFPEERPLAGMAHGNSGYVRAYACLLELTGDKDYVRRIKLLLDYEDSLYCMENGNWIDLRNKEKKETSMNAWCHGAAGILLSRLKLREIRVFREDNQVKQDIAHCLKAFDTCEPPKSSCLCHGLAGQYQILRYYLKQNSDEYVKQKSEALLQNILEEWANEEEMLPQDRYNVALMTGIAGIGLVLSVL